MFLYIGKYYGKECPNREIILQGIKVTLRYIFLAQMLIERLYILDKQLA